VFSVVRTHESHENHHVIELLNCMSAADLIFSGINGNVDST
jgi:hypothetical protein